MKISAHCYAVTGLCYSPPWEVNAGFVTGNRKTLVIDTGATALAAATIHGYARAARPANFMQVINTEKHFDHLGGNSYFRDLGIDVMAHPLASRTEQEFQAEVKEFHDAIANRTRRSNHEEAVFYGGTRIANHNKPIAAETSFDLGDLAVEVIFTPGHTLSNLSVYVPADNVLFCGDCLINGYLPNLDAGGADDWRQWLASLERIERLSPQAVVAGHGPVLTGDSVQAAIDRVRAILQKAIDAGFSPTAS